METAIAQFTYLPATKAERETFVQMCVDEVKSGVRNPLELEVMLKNLEETVNAIRKHPEVKELVFEEAEKYPEKKPSRLLVAQSQKQVAQAIITAIVMIAVTTI